MGIRGQGSRKGTSSRHPLGVNRDGRTRSYPLNVKTILDEHLARPCIFVDKLVTQLSACTGKPITPKTAVIAVKSLKPDAKIVHIELQETATPREVRIWLASKGKKDKTPKAPRVNRGAMRKESREETRRKTMGTVFPNSTLRVYGVTYAFPAAHIRYLKEQEPKEIARRLSVSIEIAKKMRRQALRSGELSIGILQEAAKSKSGTQPLQKDRPPLVRDI